MFPNVNDDIKLSEEMHNQEQEKESMKFCEPVSAEEEGMQLCKENPDLKGKTVKISLD